MNNQEKKWLTLYFLLSFFLLIFHMVYVAYLGCYFNDNVLLRKNEMTRKMFVQKNEHGEFNCDWRLCESTNADIVNCVLKLHDDFVFSFQFTIFDSPKDFSFSTHFKKKINIKQDCGRKFPACTFWQSLVGMVAHERFSFWFKNLLNLTCQVVCCWI